MSPDNPDKIKGEVSEKFIDFFKKRLKSADFDLKNDLDRIAGILNQEVGDLTKLMTEEIELEKEGLEEQSSQDAQEEMKDFGGEKNMDPDEAMDEQMANMLIVTGLKKKAPEEKAKVKETREGEESTPKIPKTLGAQKNASDNTPAVQKPEAEKPSDSGGGAPRKQPKKPTPGAGMPKEGRPAYDQGAATAPDLGEQAADEEEDPGKEKIPSEDKGEEPPGQQPEQQPRDRDEDLDEEIRSIKPKQQEVPEGTQEEEPPKERGGITKGINYLTNKPEIKKMKSAIDSIGKQIQSLEQRKNKLSRQINKAQNTITRRKAERIPLIASIVSFTFLEIIFWIITVIFKFIGGILKYIFIGYLFIGISYITQFISSGIRSFNKVQKKRLRAINKEINTLTEEIKPVEKQIEEIDDKIQKLQAQMRHLQIKILQIVNHGLSERFNQ